MLVGAVGDDFADYRSWLERHGVDCDHVHVSPTPTTPPGSCAPTTPTHAQIASFYPGAMSEAREIELEPIVDTVGEPAYVLIGADDPDGMLRHTEECRQRGYTFVADPSQQLAFGDGDLIRQLIDGADILFTNEYESHIIEKKTGWTADDVLARVGLQVTTLGADGVRMLRRDQAADRGAGCKRGHRGRADRRRRRVPGRLPRRARLGPRASSAPPRWAACSRRTSSRRSARRSTRSPPRSSSTGCDDVVRRRGGRRGPSARAQLSRRTR